MNSYDFVHLALLAHKGEICGRTKLQKTIYFLGILTDKLGDLGFRPHYYGPYSDAVAAAVNRLKSLGFLEERSLHTGACDESGFEITRSDFILTDQGKKIAAIKAREFKDFWRTLEKAVALFKNAGDIDYMKMSVAAKTYFMLSRRGISASPEELAVSAKSLGWNPKPKEIEESVHFLRKLSLVSVKP